MNANGKKPIPPNKSKKKIKKKKRSAGRIIIWMFLTCALAVFCALAGYLFVILNGQKLLDKNISKLDMDEASILYDARGKEVMKLYRENRELVSLSEVPDRLPQAFIAIEDKRFREHTGIDPWSIGRALYKDILHGSAVEGGSTITQQLAKNLFLSSDKTLFRKATEASMAIALENNYSKDSILEMYLNRIYFGSGAWGIKAASELYFGKADLSELELWEMATLAGIPKSPWNYSPILNPQKSKERRSLVLKLMHEQNYITEEEMKQAVAVDFEPLPQDKDYDYLTYIDYVMDEAEAAAGLTDEDLLRGGYRVYTTMNVKAQKIMEDTFDNDEWFQKDGPEQKVQGSMVIMNHEDGGIVAMIGGRDYVQKGLNRVTISRQPGSSFKPIAVYGPALESENWTPYSKLSDEKRAFGKYEPSNYDGRYHGEVSMFEAVKHSYNMAAVWLLNEIGVDSGMKFSTDLGIPLGSEDRNLTIALGGLTNGATPLQMARAYSAFANEGELNKPHSIVNIIDSAGREIYRFKPETKRVMSKKTAYYMTRLLQGVVEPKGTGASASMKRDVAGKTGSTQVGIKGIKSGNRDIWFVGYTPEWTAAVWIGFDKTDKNHYLKVGSGATAIIFSEVLSKALADIKVTHFVKPDDVADLAQPPSPVRDLTAAYIEEEKSVQLKWTPLQDEMSYRLYRKAGSEAEFAMLLPTDSAEIRDISVVPGETYRYYVVSYRPGTTLESQPSNEVEVVIPEEGNILDPLEPIINTGEPDGQPDEPTDGDPSADPGDDRNNGDDAVAAN